MALWAAVIITLFATAVGKPQYLVSTNGAVTPHYYQQPLTYLYSGMAHQTYFHANPFFVPHTYPANFATSSVVHYPKVQPYWFLSHCAKLKEKVAEMFSLVDANSDRKVTLAELRDDTLDDDPRMIAIWKEVFANLAGDTTESESSADDEKYNNGLWRPLFAKNDVNKDNSLNLIEFSNIVGDMGDVAFFFRPYDTNLDYYLDKTEFDDKWFSTSVKLSDIETFYLGSTDGKLSVVELLTIMSLQNNVDLGNDICAKQKKAVKG